MFYTYVLQSVEDKKFYTGFTKNLKLRFNEHQKGKVESTRDRRPLKLVYYEGSANQNDVAHREKYLKTYHGKSFIRKRIKYYLTG
jgi:putative endonuclease